MEKKLQELSLKLLDLGKRNRLLNFKDTGYRTLEILNSNIDVIFEKITSGQTLSFYSLDAILNRYNETIEGNDVSINDYSRGKVFDIAYKNLKPNDLLGYKKGYSLTKVLKVINKEYNNILVEKGINPLYLSFGLVTYTDKKIEYSAPLLLVPISMFVVNDSYKIKEYEDEVILNPTLAYLLKTEYKVNLDEYDHQPLLEYFTKVKSVLESNNMGFNPMMAIGIYSFLKMNMFNDLTNNKDIVLQNENVLRLLGSNINFKQDEKLPTYLVVNADESQIKAVEYAINGNSFVLQGPPGSGKSQTITNIISSFIGNGKKVLFVSEKQAALNVVYENLRRAGLDSFALELHSHKANKKEFIDELYKTAVLPKYDINNDVENISDNYKYVKARLEEYRKELHKVIPEYNLSIYDIYSKYLSCQTGGFSYEIKDIDKYNINKLNDIKIILDKYSLYADSYIYDYRKSPFYGIKKKDLSFARYNAEETFNLFYSFLKTVNSFKGTINSYLPIHVETLNELLDSLSIIEVISRLKNYKFEYFNKVQRSKILTNLKQYLVAYSYIKKSTIGNFFDLNILDENISLIIDDIKSSLGLFKFVKPRYNKAKKLINKYIKFRMNDKELLDKLEEVLKYQKCKDIVSNISKHIPKEYNIKEYKEIYDDMKSLEILSFDLELNKDEFIVMKNSFTDILIHFQQLSFVPKFDEVFDVSLFNLQEPLDKLLDKVLLMVNNIKYLETYVKTLEVVDELNKINVLDYLNKALDYEVKLDKISSYYEGNFYKELITKKIDKTGILKEFSDLGVDNLITEFKKLDEVMLEMNKAMVVSRLSKERPDDSILAGSHFAVLIREYNKTRRQKPIRVLLDEILDLILSIKPVFLMSPLSVSTYLSSTLNMFDVVVFDEASQVFAWDALGAVYRAKQCIIIGDSKQMPPSNFFSASSSEELDEFDLESILDKGMTIFTTKQLNFHYRSRSEELIDFSNKNFYDSRLVTIPQAKRHEKGFGVDFYYVNGQYEMKSRTNQKEASFIVDMIIDHYKNSKQSLGVVAFSNAQAEFIEELLEERLDSCPEVETLLYENKEEPFFIKNLETVQGDERDRIIFSICYGYNSENKFYQRFGPLNNVGGERRLNVAITRAKYNVSVISSIKSSDIRLDKTESVGVKLLKDYLLYAENISTKMLDSNIDIDGVVKDVAESLKEEGFMVCTNVGAGAFKVDVAVMHPATREYVIAVMLDGASYKIGNVSDVNRLQEVLLNRLGWKFYRVFSTLWVNNKMVEKDKLIKFVSSMIDAPKTIKKEEQNIDFLHEDKFELESSFMEYPYIPDAEIKRLYNELTVPGLIDHIVRIEEPISIDFLLKRICFVYGRTKVTNVVKTLFEEDLKELDLINKDGFLSTKTHTNLSLRLNSNRNIEHVHILELEDAIYNIVKKSNGIEKDGCFKTVAKLLGYSRMSENAYDYLQNALVFLMLEGKVIEKDGRLYV